MRLVRAHYKALTLELLRIPGVVVPTLLFPVALYAVFALPRSSDHETATYFMTSFTAFAVLGVAFFQFGVGVAMDRIRPWERFIRVLPVSALQLFAARVLTGLSFAFAAATPPIALALLFTPASLSAPEWVEFGLIMIVGSLPFALLGIALGYWMSPKAAIPASSLVFYPLAYVGGLFVLTKDLPTVVAKISPFTPTRQWVDLLQGLASGHPAKPWSWLALLGFAVLFGLLATAGYRRDEGQKFH